METVLELWDAFRWGLLGTVLNEGWQLLRVIESTGRFPWARPRRSRQRQGTYLTAVFIRIGLGVGVAVAIGASGQICGPMGAVAVGIAAPKIIQELSRMGLAHPAVEGPPVTPSPAPRPEEGRVDAR